MEKNQINAAAMAIAANVKAIESMRRNSAAMTSEEAAQMVLMEKFQLSQTEALEIVEGLKEGITSYNETRKSMEEDSEGTLKSILINNTAALNAEESRRYLASILTSVELAEEGNPTEQRIGEQLNANMEKSDEELINLIAAKINDMPAESFLKAGEELNAETIREAAETIDRNSDDFRFMAAVQLYISQREGTFRLDDSEEALTPRMIGALAAGAVDAMLATADYREGRISLTRWQNILKIVLGTLFAIACTCLTAVAMMMLAIPLMGFLFHLFGFGFLSVLLFFAISIPLMIKGADLSTDGIFALLEKLSPIYDNVIVKATEFVKNLYARIKGFITEKYQAAKSHVKGEEAAEESERAIEATLEDEEPMPGTPALA